ncbi:MAG: acyl-CoA desaturase [Gemmataceae bacterium]|nr:acyl-CoA desaturase [Gemmataceae bacterium]
MQTLPPLTLSRPVPHPPTSPSRPKFPHDHTGFHAELRRRVGEYFAATGKQERGGWRIYTKTIIIMCWLAVSYALLVFVAPAWWAAVPLAVVLAAAMAAAAFNVQHDGGHRAYSNRPWVNRLAALSLDMIGASSYLWHWKHVVFHHTYSNISGHDADIELGSLMRFCPHHRRRWFHRWQHLYLWALYGLMAARWHLFGDFKDVITGMVGPHRVPRPRGWDLFVFLGGKAFSIGWLIVLPLFFHEWWVVLIYYFLATAVMGVILSVVFQLAHCVGEADFPIPVDGTLRMEAAWAIHQVQTTADFARGSRVLSWLLGGLNFQIEHHLLPQVCHVHYPALCGIVETVCREYGVRYSAHPTFWAGVVSHYRWLREMGRHDRPIVA